MWQLSAVVAIGFVATNAFLYKMRREFMSFGTETQSALAELDEAISSEIDEFAQWAITATGSDGTLAAAIRERAARVKGIVTATADEGAVVVPEPQSPVGEDPVEEDGVPVTEDDLPEDVPVVQDVPALSDRDIDDR